MEILETSRILFAMHRISVTERVVICLAALGFFAVIVVLFAIGITEEQAAQHRSHERKPMLGVISDTNSVR